MDTQLKKDFLEIAVLAILDQHDSYGYNLVQELRQIMDVSESSLYPVLKRLEMQGCLKTYTVEHRDRLRKYYRITDEGKERIHEFLDNWSQVVDLHAFIRKGYANG